MSTPKRGTSIERDNPFRPGGDIEKEVDIILRSSTISADKITIVDPSSPHYTKSTIASGDTPDSPIAETDTQHDNNEQVVVSVNTGVNLDITDSNDNVKEEKPADKTVNIETNGHTPDDTGKIDTPKKKKKSKKTCQII